MPLSIGIVGLPNVGKSTLFTALTKKEVEIANYPFATIDPNVGIVEVPDERLNKLAELSHSKKIIPTVIEFVDIAGLVKGAHKGEGLGNKFLNHIREVDAMLYLVRAFQSEDIHHVEKSVDPLRDIKIIRDEVALKDLEVLEKRVEKAAGEARSGDKNAKKELDILQCFQENLNEGVHIHQYMEKLEQDDDSFHWQLLKELQLLTSKPAMYLINAQEEEVTDDLKDYIKSLGGYTVVMDVAQELEGAGLTDEERGELDLGISQLPNLITESYRALNLITFLTTGEDETRAWTVRKGSRAPEAAGVIHGDFEEKFIRAEVIWWEKLLEVEGWSNARAEGSLRTEGKDYIVQDGDVLVVLHGA